MKRVSNWAQMRKPTEHGMYVCVCVRASEWDNHMLCTVGQAPKKED